MTNKPRATITDEEIQKNDKGWCIQYTKPSTVTPFLLLHTITSYRGDTWRAYTRLMTHNNDAREARKIGRRFGAKAVKVRVTLLEADDDR